MRTAFFLLWAISLLFRISAEEPLDLWMQARSARGRVVVRAADAVPMQQLSLWAERSLKQLEADWRRVIPFQKGQSFTFVIDPKAGRIQFRQEWRQNILHQTLRLPASAMREESRLLAEQFTRAMLYRVGLASMPPDEKNRNWEIPDWVVKGSAHALLSDRSRALYSIMVVENMQGSPPYPEVISSGSGNPVPLKNEAAAALLCRWLFQENPPDFWRMLSENAFLYPESWAELFPALGNLRELHVYWDVWWMNERNQLMADYALGEAALIQLKQEQEFIPAFYGLEMEGENRYATLRFPQLKPYLDHPRFGTAMQEWILRLQRLRFRQSPEFNLQVEQLQEAGRLAIRAGQAKGRKRERLWSEAVESSSTNRIGIAN